MENNIKRNNEGMCFVHTPLLVHIATEQTLSVRRCVTTPADNQTPVQLPNDVLVRNNMYMDPNAATVLHFLYIYMSTYSPIRGWRYISPPPPPPGNPNTVPLGVPCQGHFCVPCQVCASCHSQFSVASGKLGHIWISVLYLANPILIEFYSIQISITLFPFYVNIFAYEKFMETSY